jgi:hypothetical protein
MMPRKRYGMGWPLMTRTLEIMLKRPLRLNRWLWLIAIRIGIEEACRRLLVCFEKGMD